MTTITRSISKGQIVPLDFVQDAVAASQSDAQLSVAEDQSLVKGYEMPWDGEVVGLSFKLDTAGTAGTFTIGATVNGTENTDHQITVGTDDGNYLRIPRGEITFNASDAIGAEITTDGSWDGTTSDLLVTVWCVVYLEAI